MIWFLLQQIGFFIFLFLTIRYVVLKKYYLLLLLYFWGLVFANCFQFFITIWFPTKIVSLGMLVVLLQFHRKYTKTPIAIKIIIQIIIILVLFSNAIAIFLPGPIDSEINPFKRLILQDYSYLSSAILLVYPSVLKPKYLKAFYVRYCFIIEIIIILGLVHYVFNLAGIPFAPILRVGGFSDVADVIANFNGSKVNRIYAFSGEPKNLGFTIAPYLIISFFMYFKGEVRKSHKYHIIFLTLGFWVLYNTFSSSAFIAVTLSFIFIFLTYKVKIKAKLLGLIFIFLTSFSILYLIKTAKDIPLQNNNSFFEAFYDRSFGRATQELQDNRQESIIWNTFIKEDITHLIFGYGPGQYVFHVEGQLNDDGLIPVQSGVIRTIVDFGFLGLICFGFYGFLIFRLLILSNK